MAEALKTAARTNREGGEKSPGSPGVPAPLVPTAAISRRLSQPAERCGIEGNVIAQVRDVPVKGRRVQDPETIVVNLELSIDRFDYDTRRYYHKLHSEKAALPAPNFQDSRCDDALTCFDGAAHFADSCKLRQYPVRKVHRR